MRKTKTRISVDHAKRQYVMARVRIEPYGCWSWQGSRYGSGYGRAYWAGQAIGAHRFAYEAWHGPLGPKMQAGHKTGCSSPLCVNPDHLVPQSCSENITECAARRLERRQWTDVDRQTAKADVISGPGTDLEKAQRNGMSCTMARLIRYGRRWQNVEAA